MRKYLYEIKKVYVSGDWHYFPRYRTGWFWHAVTNPGDTKPLDYPNKGGAMRACDNHYAQAKQRHERSLITYTKYKP